jgi:DNA adenine methylase
MNNIVLDDKNMEIKPKPFIKWAGGKNWLTNRIDNFLPKKYNNYHELFLGGAAIFFHIQPKNHSFLSDLNLELINTYEQIKKNPQKVIEHLERLDVNKENYYKIRATDLTDLTYNAARFIFLNKSCYNGIYRVNASGKFNVPYGHNSNVKIYDKNNLLAINTALKNTTLNTQDFENGLDKIEKYDLIFIDPPYTVAHNNNGFIEYNKKIFMWEDQERLADFVNRLNKKGAYYILTNAVHESIVDLYKYLGKRYELGRYSTIASQIEKRRKITEYLITNCI